MNKKSFLIVAILMLVGGAVFAQGLPPQTATLNISGVIPQYVEVSLSASDITDFDLVAGDSRDVTVSVVTNIPYKLKVESLNSFAFKGGASGTETISYTAKWGGVAIADPISVATGAATLGATDVGTFTVDVTGVGSSAYSAGTYSDQLTFTVVAN